MRGINKIRIQNKYVNNNNVNLRYYNSASPDATIDSDCS